VVRTETEERSRRAAILWAVVLLAIVLGSFIVPVIVAPLDTVGSRLLGRWLVEVWLLVGLVAWSLHRVDVRELLTVSQRTVAVVLVAGLAMSQFSFGRLGSYPFLTWGMYTISQDRVVYADLVMLDGDEEVGRLPVSALVPASDARGFLSRVEELLRRAEQGDEEARDTLTLTIRRLLAAHGDLAVEAVDLRWCDVTGAGHELRSVCTTALVVRR
jgi:hypothetical protein